MRKILFCNLDLLKRKFEGYDQVVSQKHRDKFLDCMVKLNSEDDNIVCFVSRNNTHLDLG